MCVDPQVVNGNGERQSDHVTSDPELGLEPAVPKDFQVFINLVDLCRYRLINAFFFASNKA